MKKYKKYDENGWVPSSFFELNEQELGFGQKFTMLKEDLNLLIFISRKGKKGCYKDVYLKGEKGML